MPIPPLDTLDPAFTDISWAHQPTQTTTAATSFGQLTQLQQRDKEVLHAWTDTTMYAPPVLISLPINRHATLGFICIDDPTQRLVFLRGCQEGTAASRLPRWRSRIRSAVLCAVNGTVIRSMEQLLRAVVRTLQKHHAATATIIFAKIEPRTQPDTDVPQLHFDQLVRHINHIHAALKQHHSTTVPVEAFLLESHKVSTKEAHGL